MKRPLLVALLAATASLVLAPIKAPADAGGLAWDSVTKMVMGADASSLQPGSFDADYAAAAAAQPPSQSGGGIFSQFKQAMAQGQNMQQMMQTGIAQRHYVAGSKERTDDVAQQTATIVDCAARTITTLDLRNKTYRVVSMDQASAPSTGGGRGPLSGLSDNNTRVAIALTNTALGARDVSGLPANGFRSDMTITETTGSGETRTQNADMLAYYSSYDNPSANCSHWTATGGRGAGMMAGYAQLMRALSSTGADSRFSVSQSGPPLPRGKLALYDATTFSFGAQGQGMTMVTERGNVRAIGADDPVFSVPAGFTQQQ